jgi:16S rRNA (cytosine967-C5)-methyltransferase
MICNKFQKKHLLILLERFNFGPVPLDLCCHRYFKETRALGSTDRRVIQNASYSIIKNLLFIDALSSEKTSWQNRIDTLLSSDLEEKINSRVDLDNATRTSLPEWLYSSLCKSYGEEKTLMLGHCLRQKAPTYLRANTLKSSKEAIMKLLGETLELESVDGLRDAIKVHTPVKFNTFKEFLEGHFELQDASSQLVVEKLELKGSERILDFCAGSGGKSLHLCAKLQNKGQVNLFDNRPRILANAKKRLKKAGAFNTKIYTEKKQLNRLKHKMDIVLTDVPCSGTGTLRRSPEQKYKLTKVSLKSLIQQQRDIVKDALQYLKPTGRLVYSTCSILKEENDEQVAYFKKHFNLVKNKESTQVLPAPNQGDGFFFVEFIFNS